jgi:hypothetical protein
MPVDFYAKALPEKCHAETIPESPVFCAPERPLCFSIRGSHRPFFRALTTAAINQATGTIDATGCDIGDYIFNSVSTSGTLMVHDANQYGIFVDSGNALTTGPITVSISGAIVYNIGAHTTGGAFNPNGVQTGIGIIFDSGPSGYLATGSITSSTIYAYQKGGIVVEHNSDVSTTGNTVTGLGPVNFIAGNGIEYAVDAVGTIRGNTVSANYYTGMEGILADGSPCGPSQSSTCPPGRVYVATGILLVLVDPNNIQRGQNDATDNQAHYIVVTDAATD